MNSICIFHLKVRLMTLFHVKTFIYQIYAILPASQIFFLLLFWKHQEQSLCPPSRIFNFDFKGHLLGKKSIPGGGNYLFLKLDQSVANKTFSFTMEYRGFVHFLNIDNWTLLLRTKAKTPFYYFFLSIILLIITVFMARLGQKQNIIFFNLPRSQATMIPWSSDISI